MTSATATNALSYLAPSRNGYGWGVFSCKAFQKGDIVDVAPMFLRVDLEELRLRVLKETVLNNYHYEYWGWDGIRGKECQYSMISFGMTLYYNHQSPPPPSHEWKNKNHRLDDDNPTPSTKHPAGPNIEQRKVGKEPDMDFPDRAAAIIYFALRDIEPGEELLVDYGGSDWFRGRGMHEITTNDDDGDELAKEGATNAENEHQETQHKLMQELSGKIYGGYHQEAFRRIMGSLDEDFLIDNPLPFRLDTIVDRLPTDKACFGRVTARARIQQGETIEYVPVLLLRKDWVETSRLLHPLAFSWQDVADHNFSEGGRPSHVQVQYQPDTEHIVPSTKVKIRIEDTVFIALVGTTSLMARAPQHEAIHNAVLQVEPDPYNEDGFCFRVVACLDIEPKQRIVLGVNRWNPTWMEAIVQELCLTGQPFEASS